MTRHRTHRIAAFSAAGAVLALGAGVLAAGPAQAEDAPATAPASTTAAAAQPSAETFENLALVRSATEPTVYWLKAPAPGGIGEVPAPDGKYSVDLSSQGQHEHFVVTSHEGRLDLKDSHILKTARFDPQITVEWVG